MPTTSPKPRPKPRLRGVPHVIGSLAALPAGLLLAHHATAGLARTGAIVYALSLFGLLSVSAFYHTPHWPHERRMKLRRLDHAMIFVLIAGTYTPFFLLLETAFSGWVLPFVWGVTTLGILKTIFWPQSPRLLGALAYVALGWVVLPFLTGLFNQNGATVCGLIAGGGFFYTVGALIYARRWPDPKPELFGYHEIFHVLILVASVMHYTAVWMVV